MQRFVVCGEALIDLAPVERVDLFGTPATSTFRTTWEALSAGGPMNTAVGLARLGERVEFCGRLSTDRFGRQLQSHLVANAVGLELAVVTDDPTSLAAVSLDENQKASYAFHFANTANFGWTRDELPELGEDDWLHIGSLATIVEPAAPVLLEWVRSTAARVSLDINVRPTVIADPGVYWETVRPWLETVGEHGGVLKASDDDVAFLARGAGVDGDPVEVLAGWGDEVGAAVSVVTLGSDGAAAAAGERVVRRPGRTVEVVDTVGAGDTFMAGFLASYANDASLEDALDRGIAASALVCTRQGPQPPTRGELEAALTRP
ncbi:carbohydrate kinase family protein [Mariniluteicoccus flavus]